MDRDTHELVTALGAFPAFAGTDEQDLVALVRVGSVVPLPDRWTFLHEGTPADAVYVLLEGTAQVKLATGGTVDLAPGAVLGEMALLGQSLRRADVRTTSRVRMLRLDYGPLQQVLQARPRLAAAIGAVYESRRG